VWLHPDLTAGEYPFAQAKQAMVEHAASTPGARQRCLSEQ
jgi:hypothetical protein